MLREVLARFGIQFDGAGLQAGLAGMASLAAAAAAAAFVLGGILLGALRNLAIEMAELGDETAKTARSLGIGANELAAWQFEFKAVRGEVAIAGVESGEHAAFRKAPYYDLAALRGGRIIIAAFSTDRDLPRGKTRVARLHLYVRGDVKPEYKVELEAAADPDGKEIEATVSISKGAEE